jgi:tetratricopeptide (TPR) repeat protein
MMQKLLLGFLACCFPFWLSAQIFNDSVFQEKAWKGVNYLYDLRFDKAAAVFEELKQAYPEHPAPYFLLGTNRWWQNYLAEETPIYYDYVEDILEMSLEKNEKLEEQPDLAMEYTYFEFMGRALLSKVHAAQGEWWSAVNAARKVMGPIKEGFAYTDVRPEFAFASGLYHYYAETYPDEYPVVKPFMVFFPNADAELGLKEMEQAAAKKNYAQIECLFYLSYIYLEERKEWKKGLRVTQTLTQKYPNNSWFQADHAHALLLNDRYDQARKVLAKLVKKFEAQPGHDTQNIDSRNSIYTSHLMIKVYQYMGKVALFGDREGKAAIEWFEKSEKMARFAQVEEDHLLAEDMYYKGRSYDLLGQREQARQAYKTALKMDGNLYIKDDAKACLKSPCQ